MAFLMYIHHPGKSPALFWGRKLAVSCCPILSISIAPSLIFCISFLFLRQPHHSLANLIRIQWYACKTGPVPHSEQPFRRTILGSATVGLGKAAMNTGFVCSEHCIIRPSLLLLLVVREWGDISDFVLFSKSTWPILLFFLKVFLYIHKRIKAWFFESSLKMAVEGHSVDQCCHIEI